MIGMPQSVQEHERSAARCRRRRRKRLCFTVIVVSVVAIEMTALIAIFAHLTGLLN